MSLIRLPALKVTGPQIRGIAIQVPFGSEWPLDIVLANNSEQYVMAYRISIQREFDIRIEKRTRFGEDEVRQN